jgi:hypothetical protein
MVVVVVLPSTEFFVEQVDIVADAALVQQLVELLVIDSMRALHLPVETRRPWADADVAEVFPSAAAVNDALRLLVALADAKASRRDAGARRQSKKLRVAGRTARKSPAKRRSGDARG